MAGDRDFRGLLARIVHGAALAVLAGLSVVLTQPSSARAEPLPLTRDVSLGAPASRVEVQVVTEGDDTRIRVRTGRHTADATVHARLVDAEVERVMLASGASVGVVRGTGPDGRVAALVVVRRGRASIPWVGRLDMRGDPGEQTADVIELSDRTGDGHPDVVVGQAREGVALCGQEAALLYPRALDPATGELRPVVLRRVPAVGEELEIVASATSPGPTGEPLARSLRAVGASSELGVDEDARALDRPRAVVDGDPATYWAEGRGGAGDGELVSLRFGAEMPIRALAITPASAPGVSAPRTIWLVGDRGPRLRVMIPEGLEGRRAWIVPPAPLEWSCFALVLADPGGAASARTGIAEIDAFTELDFGGGIEALVAELVRDGEAGDRATLFLSRLGAPAVAALDAAWDRLGARGRERAVRVAVGPARGGDAAALTVLGRAANDHAAEVRAAALEALASSGAAGIAATLEIAAATGAGAEEAAARLSEASEGFDVSPLLGSLGAEGGSERPALRVAIARGVALGGESAVEAVAAWAADAPIGARASLAQGLASDEGTRALAAEVVAGALEDAQTFVDRFRLTRAAALLEDRSPAIAAWLAEIARGAEEWMLRSAAIDALGASQRASARAALEDSYPRVRTAAVTALASSDEDEPRLISIAREDPWPMVRITALDAVSDRAGARDALRAAVADDAQTVRRRAIEHLTRLGDREVTEAVQGRLRDGDEWPIVVEAALAYVQGLCLVEAGPAVLEVIRRGTREGAWEPDVEVAIQALRVATRLGGETAEDARRVATRGNEVMRAAVEASRADDETCR